MKNPMPKDIEIVGQSSVSTITGETITVVVYSDKSTAVVYN